MHRALAILGLLLIAAGGLWALQGAGIVLWPAESFMLRRQAWVIYGAATALAGALLLALARRQR